MPPESPTDSPRNRHAKDPIQLFASSATDPRSRRAVDGLRLALQAIVIVTAALFSRIAVDIDQRLSEVMTTLPGFLQVVWTTGFWAAAGWSVTLLVITVVRRRVTVAFAALAAAVLAATTAVIAGAIVVAHGFDVLGSIADSNGPPVFPPGAVAVTAAVLATMSPYLTVPFRRFGRVLMALQAVGALCLGISLAFGTVVALSIGLIAGFVVHLVWGSPAGVPTVTRVQRALRDLGVDVHDLTPVSVGHEGVALLVGDDAEGPLQVKVYGRDALEGQFLVSVWRRAWFREAQHRARLSRSEYVEHEGFMSSLAARAGVRVPAVVTAGLADNGDALIAVRTDGAALTTATPALTPKQVVSLWSDLALLHSHGIVHQQLDLDRIVVRSDMTAGFGDLSSASLRSTEFQRLADRAQLFALTILTIGKDAAIELAESAIGRDGLTALLPNLQEAALPPRVRAALHHEKVDLSAVRKELALRIDAKDVELAKIRRVTAKSILNLALLVVAAYTMIGLFSGIDFGSLGQSLANANWWWLAAALIVCQMARVANALSTMGSSTTDLPVGPTTALNFATCYVNLAVPSSAGRIAIMTRYFQRFGIPPAAALSAGVIDSLSEFVVQVVLFLLVFSISDVDLGLSLNTNQLSGLSTVALLIVGAVIVAIVVALLVPSIRAKVRLWLHQAHEALGVLRMPRKLAQLFGGNLMSQLLFAVALGACVRGLHYDVPLSSLILINTVVGLFAGLLPVPGGIGVSEAGITLGLTRVGIPADTALAIALTHRFCAFYLPPFWGYACYRWLVDRKYL